ncbi:uncharacterized protein LOC123293135 [Chrysoperla carnea]|uniref:uncharacterized protein LOC123293135 n=1 Tax=Chrysoperla carnea TaxID=189513 RepID=UPI001D093EFF|nr:uncharacterized protein LOC123293135 [Chrysoperla carnea]
MRNRTLTGNLAIVIYLISLFCVVIAFSTSSWLVSDYRIRGAKFDRLGLWTHCFRSLPDPTDVYQRRFFVGCRWVFDPFTKGYDEIRGFLIPGFMIATQFFYTITFICALISAVLVLMYFLCCSPDQNKFTLFVRGIGLTCLVGGISGCIGVIVFAIWGNTDGWMPGHENNWFGYSFVLAIVGAVGFVIAAGLFLVEENVQVRKQRHFKDSQTRFELEQESKA